MCGAAGCCQQGLPGQLHNATDAPFGLEVVLALLPVCDVQLDVFSASPDLWITASSRLAAIAAGTAQRSHRRPPRFETFFLNRSTLQVEVKVVILMAASLWEAEPASPIEACEWICRQGKGSGWLLVSLG